jgi:hypothetical protein
MKALFAKADEPERVIARATWLGPSVHIEADDDAAREALRRIFRPVPVVTADPSLRSAGTKGDVQLPPGSLSWFLAAARERGRKEGLLVSLAPSEESGLGWDPAGTYRTFPRQVERMQRVRAGHREAPPG